MVNLAVPAQSVSVIQADRVRAGQPVKKELVAVITDDGTGLSTLEIITDGRKCDRYGLEELPVGGALDGRGFALYRDPAVFAKEGPEADDQYQTFVARNGQDNSCTCLGHSRHGRCKHVDALRGLIQDGLLEEIGADAPVQPFPSDEQVLADAIERPF